MRWQQIVDRFRPVSAPGGAAESAEHVADRTGPALELAPVFALLDPDLEAARHTLDTADTRAAAQLDDARQRAASLLAQARREAPAREAEAAAHVLTEAAKRDAALVDDARRRSRDELHARSPQLDAAARAVVDRLVDTLKALP